MIMEKITCIRKKKTYPYDDFIFNNMNRIGYQKMQEVLRKYIRYLSGEKIFSQN